jgi:hypothetical protein
MVGTFTAQFSFNNKALELFSVSLHGDPIPAWLNESVGQAFEALAPFIKNESQVLYVRDIPLLNIDGKYPLGHCYNEYEAMISVLSWTGDKPPIIASINHELHHMARWQNPGYGDTLGGALVSEGIATYYEERTSGWAPPWSKAAVSDDAKEAALKGWNDKDYNHGEWFFGGPYGKWVGYGLGYQLAQKLFADTFDLTWSVVTDPNNVRELLRQL